MVQTSAKPLTLEEFLASPESNESYELIDGAMIPKVSPKRFHSKTTGALYLLLKAWSQNRGEVGIEWSVILTCQGQPWVPIPDLLFVSYERLSLNDQEDGPCPVPPDLAIEVISPEQAMGTLLAKVTDYLSAGVLRVWLVDPKAKTITVFYPDAPPCTYMGQTPITDTALPDLNLSAQEVFTQAGLIF